MIQAIQELKNKNVGMRCAAFSRIIMGACKEEWIFQGRPDDKFHKAATDYLAQMRKAEEYQDITKPYFANKA